MRILAIDHGSKRIGIAVSDELKMIAQPLEFIAAEPFARFLARLKELIRDKQVELDPRRDAAEHGWQLRPGGTESAGLRGGAEGTPSTVPIQTWDERLTSAQANRLLIQGNVRRDKRKEKVDKMAAAILLQSYLDSR